VHCLHRYVQLNVQYSDEYRQYNTDLPEFLRNRPRDFVLHVSSRWTSATTYSSKKVKELDTGRFVVDSEERRHVKYLVRLGDNRDMPHCQCYDWSKYHWPCKHILAVFQNSEYTWDSLSPLYRDSPFFTLDTELMSATPTYDRVVDDSAAPHADAVADDAVSAGSQDGQPAISLSATLARCREILRSLTDASFICNDQKGAEGFLRDLEHTQKQLATFLPNDGGLFLRDPPKRSQRRKKVRQPDTGRRLLRKRTSKVDKSTPKRVRFDDSMPDNEGRTSRMKVWCSRFSETLTFVHLYVARYCTLLSLDTQSAVLSRQVVCPSVCHSL